MPAADIGQQIGQQITAAVRHVPEMVVRIDDRQIRFQRRFARLFLQPCFQRGVVAVDAAAIFAFGLAELWHLRFLLPVG